MYYSMIIPRKKPTHKHTHKNYENQNPIGKKIIIDETRE